MYDFANLDREKRADGLKFWLFGKKIQNISAEIIVERSSRVLVFRDLFLDAPPSYILEVKVIAARLKSDISLKQDASAGFLIQTDNQSVRICDDGSNRTCGSLRRV